MSLIETKADHVGQPIWNPYFGAIHILEAEVASHTSQPRYYVIADPAFDFETTGKVIISFVCPKTKRILINYSVIFSTDLTTEYLMYHFSVIYGWSTDLYFAKETSSWLFKTKRRVR